jgi:hypothetical protein
LIRRDYLFHGFIEAAARLINTKLPSGLLEPLGLLFVSQLRGSLLSRRLPGRL